MIEEIEAFTSLDTQVSGVVEAQTFQALHRRWGYGTETAPVRSIVLSSGVLPPVPPVLPMNLMLAQVPFPVWVSGDEVWLGEALYLKVSGRNVHLTLGRTAIPEEAWMLAFTEAHRVGGWLPLHAAVLTRLGQGVGITGVSGAGKSTAALRLAGAGLTVLSEDQAWLRPEDQRVVGFDQHLRAFKDSLETFAPHLLDSVIGRDVHGKCMLPLTQPGGKATLRGLLVLGQPALLTTAQRVRAIWETVGVPLTQAGRTASALAVNVLLSHLEVVGTTRDTVAFSVQERLGVFSSGK